MSEDASPKWRVHTARVLGEVMENPTTWPLKIPLLSLDNLLRQVASRAIEIDDTRLNQLMCQLTLYSVADPFSPDYNCDLALKIIRGDAHG